MLPQITGLLLGVIAASLAKKEGYNAWLGLVIVYGAGLIAGAGGALFAFGVFYFFLLVNAPERNRITESHAAYDPKTRTYARQRLLATKQCPHCAETILQAATLCRYCASQVEYDEQTSVASLKAEERRLMSNSERNANIEAQRLSQLVERAHSLELTQEEQDLLEWIAEGFENLALAEMYAVEPLKTSLWQHQLRGKFLAANNDEMLRIAQRSGHLS